jgi:D-galactose 1-dehydrogenase
MTKIKLGLVGVGKIARDQHLPVLAASSAFELVAVASRNATVPGIPCYRDMSEMLSSHPEIEAVTLCTPPGPRELDARIALSRGVHVLLEKPPAASLGAALELAAFSGRAVVSMSWHSRHAPAVKSAREWLRGRDVREVMIDWREDIRVWHPGQDWILDAGGMGVFDPGINALSILTDLVPEPMVLESSQLGVSEGRQAPLKAELVLRTRRDVRIRASFDFLQTGAQTWTIRFVARDSEFTLTNGGAGFRTNGIDQSVRSSRHHEYEGVYKRFADHIRTGTNDCDVRPLQIVADAFMLGRHEALPAFTF